MPKESEFTGKLNPLCQNTERWTARDAQSSEDEVGEFLYGLVRLIKPALIVETGCYVGDATLPMADAIYHNEYGKIMACDIDEKRVAETNGKLNEYWVSRIIGTEVVMPEVRALAMVCKGVELIKAWGAQIEFAFIDSAPDGKGRGEEIEMLLRYVKKGTLFALHDTAPQQGSIAEMAGRVKAKSIYFNTPRGLTLYQKE